MKRLTIEIAKKNVGKYIDCYKHICNGYWPKQIIEINGIPALKDALGVCTKVDDVSSFNYTYYDWMFDMATAPKTTDSVLAEMKDK